MARPTRPSASRKSTTSKAPKRTAKKAARTMTQKKTAKKATKKATKKKSAKKVAKKQIARTPAKSTARKAAKKTTRMAPRTTAEKTASMAPRKSAKKPASTAPRPAARRAPADVAKKPAERVARGGNRQSANEIGTSLGKAPNREIEKAVEATFVAQFAPIEPEVVFDDEPKQLAKAGAGSFQSADARRAAITANPVQSNRKAIFGHISGRGRRAQGKRDQSTGTGTRPRRPFRSS
jgi:hypothetical protein